MSGRKSLFPLVFITMLLLLSLTLTVPVGSASTKTRIVYLLDYWGLTVRIEAPYTAESGENISITINAEAEKDVNDANITLNIYGLGNQTDEITLGETINFTLQSGDVYKSDYEVSLPGNISAGLTYGKIECNWTFETTVGDIKIFIPESVHSGFPVTYVENKEFEELQKEYEELNETYNCLMSNYTSLNNTYTELESRYEASAGEIAGTRNLMYVFIATTIIAGVTAVLIGVRKPKSGTYF